MKTLSLSWQRASLPLAAAFLMAASDAGHAQSNSIFSVVITEPADKSIFIAPTNVMIDASVYDPLGEIAYVSFSATTRFGVTSELGVVSNGVSLDPPRLTYIFDWDPALAGDDWSLVATAVRGNGMRVMSAPIQISVLSGDSLSVDIASPTNGTIFPEPTNIELIAGVIATNVGPAFVEFFDGLQSLGVVSNGFVIDPPGSPGLPPGGRGYFLDWTNQSLGSHKITAVATDTSGNTFSSAPVTIFVGSTTTPPLLQIITPTNASTFIAPASVQFEVSVYDPGGDVTGVGFSARPAGPGPLPDFVINLGTATNWTSTNPPTKIFTFAWTNTPVGTWLVEAGAIHNDGSPGGSDSVLFTVLKSDLLTVDIASPTNGAIFPVSTNIQLIAGVVVKGDSPASVEFFDGAQSLGVVTNGVVVDPPGSPGLPPGSRAYFFNWTTQTFGIHEISAIARDTNGYLFYSGTVTIIVGNVTTPPPTIQFVQPTNGSTFFAPANVPLAVSVYDPAGEVAAVSFVAYPEGTPLDYVIYLGSVSNFISLDPPTKVYMFDWSNAILGAWSVRAEALRGDGSPVGEASVLFKVQRNIPLSVDIASPANGAAFPGPTNIQLVAGVVATNDTPAFVEFFDGSHPIGVTSNWAVVDPPGSPGLPPGSRAYFFDWTNQSLGIHVLTAAVTDTNGDAVTSSPVTITVGIDTNFPPLVRITSPPNRSMFRAPVNIPLVAFALSPFGSVQSVEFFAGSNNLGFGRRLAIASPIPGPDFVGSVFELTWSNAAPGFYALTALVADNDGGSATSAPVNITIEQPSTPPSNQVDVVSIVATDPIAIASTNCWSWLGGPLTWSNWSSPVAIWRWRTNCGPVDASFTVRRFGSTNDDLTVNYSVGGTATNGADYVALPGSITIPAGQCEAAITVVPIDVGASNTTSTVVIGLTPTTNVPPNYVLGFPGAAEAIIIDSFVPRAEPGGAVLPDRSFHLSLNGPDGAWFHIDYATDLLHWTPICTNQVINGSIDFIDPNAANSPVREYRAIPMPNPPSD